MDFKVAGKINKNLKENKKRGTKKEVISVQQLNFHMKFFFVLYPHTLKPDQSIQHPKGDTFRFFMLLRFIF